MSQVQVPTQPTKRFFILEPREMMELMELPSRDVKVHGRFTIDKGRFYFIDARGNEHEFHDYFAVHTVLGVFEINGKLYVIVIPPLRLSVDVYVFKEVKQYPIN